MVRLLPRFLILSLFALAGSLAAADAPGVVTVEIHESGVSRENVFPSLDAGLKPTETYTEDLFGLFELPQKYVSTGVRADRAFPTLVRATATVTLPPGKHRLLLRARGQSRVLIDGKTVLETPFDQPRQFAVGNAGELPVEEQNAPLDLGPGYRFVPPGNREKLTEVAFSGKPVSVVLETFVGALLPPKRTAPFRPELGETVIAVALEGTTEWRLLSPGPRQVAYTDAAWNAYAAERRLRLDAMNSAARAARRAEHSAYWDSRRSAAQTWLKNQPAIAVPALPPGYPAHNTIDHFIGARIAEVAAAAAPAKAKGGIDFHREIRPIFEQSCYSCHQGGKVKGGLRLDIHAGALLGGKADGPSIVPHQPAQSPIFQRITSTDTEEIMPAKGDPLSPASIALIKRWIEQGAPWPDFAVDRFELTPLADDLTFLRRLALDTVGVTPTEAEVAAFLSDRSADRRARAIDRFLADP
ncbi:MAG TPA: c-type cytochrome domain-containing protein, partial [Opitutaceae bacterium]